MMVGGDSEPVDPNFKNVTLLLKGEGTNGAQNNTFLDSSPNNHTLSKTGNVAQGSFSPFGSSWSAYFDGSSGGDCLNIASDAAFAFGTGDFTIEMFLFGEAADTGPFAPTALSFPDGSGQTIQIWMAVPPNNSPAGPVAFVPGVGTGNYYSGLGLGKWVHVAITRASGTARIFFNGVQVVSGAYTTNIPATSFYIGNVAAGTGPYQGLISNLRIVKGTALYTANFTPPTATLTAVSGTSLLTCHKNRLVDDSSNAFSIPRTGEVAVVPASPFGPPASYNPATHGGSMFVDGSGADYVLVPSTASSMFGQLATGNYTIEGWLYPTTTASGTLQTILHLANGGVTDSVTVFKIVYWNGGGGPGSETVTALVPDSGTSVGLNVLFSSLKSRGWNHFALVKNGTTHTWFINGQMGQSFSVTSPGVFATASMAIGSRFDGNEPFTGYISQLRLTDQVVYTASFTPPTAPVGVITNTRALLNFANAGIIDSAGRCDIETFLGIKVGTGTVKYGTGAIDTANASTGILYYSDPSILNFRTRDFTVEFWIYPPVSSGGGVLLISTNGGVAQFDVSINSNTIYTRIVGTYVSGAGFAVPTNTWSHIAIVRSGNDVKTYLNGVGQEIANVGSADILPSTVPVRSMGTPAVGYAAVYIDDLRVTNGIARYTANFTPPTSLPTK